MIAPDKMASQLARALADDAVRCNVTVVTGRDGFRTIRRNSVEFAKIVGVDQKAGGKCRAMMDRERLQAALVDRSNSDNLVWWRR